MADKNIFNLEGRADGPATAHRARVWTADEQAEKLNGYIEIAPDLWDQIRYGTHMRYITKAGEFRSGGFVLKNPFDTKSRGAATEKRFIKLQNGFSDKTPGYQQWLAAYEDIAKVYVKPDATVLTMLRNLETAVHGLNENIKKVAEYSKKLEARLTAVEKR